MDHGRTFGLWGFAGSRRLCIIDRVLHLDHHLGPMPPYFTCRLVGLGGLFYGVTGPLLSTFVPILVRNALEDHRTLIGMVMAIDNVLLLLLVPCPGVIADRAASRGAGEAETGFDTATAIAVHG